MASVLVACWLVVNVNKLVVIIIINVFFHLDIEEMEFTTRFQVQLFGKMARDIGNNPISISC